MVSQKIFGSELSGALPLPGQVNKQLLARVLGWPCHKFATSGVVMVVNASSEAAVETSVGESPFDIETVFLAQYDRVARVIARVVRDPARAEELAVEVFLKLWQTPQAQGKNMNGWIYRAAVRKGLDELRRRTRRSRYESWLRLGRAPSPEEILVTGEEQERVRLVLAILSPRQAELLLLRSQGLSYDELASALDLNVASVGTLLSRAQRAFRKEYIKRYGQE
jgi:RNA polymerase sigma-70 factor, ECF subfamily